jgi:hypothetical protein
MHGVVLWRASEDPALLLQQTSALVTWEDQRCTPAVLAAWPAGLATGFGCATLSWLAQEQPLAAGYR